MSAPVIAISGRQLRAGAVTDMDPRYRGLDFNVYFADYGRCLAAAGALPVQLPYDIDPEQIITRVDGVLITGGQDLHPASWGGEDFVNPQQHPDLNNLSAYDPHRDTYEFDLIRAALAHHVPLLGVCRGHQALNVALGGTLIPDLSTTGPVTHYQSESAPHAGSPAHQVHLGAGTLASRVLGTQVVRNSWHHQAVDRCGTDLVVSGRTSDGVVEVVELPGLPVLGVQWHPEWQPDNDPILDWLVEAAAAVADRRPASDVSPRLTGASPR